MYNYKNITINIFKEINNRGFIIGSLAVASILVIAIKVAVIRKEFIIFEFINNKFKFFYVIFVNNKYLYNNYLII